MRGRDMLLHPILPTFCASLGLAGLQRASPAVLVMVIQESIFDKRDDRIT